MFVATESFTSTGSFLQEYRHVNRPGAPYLTYQKKGFFATTLKPSPLAGSV